jgi:hypothetical protein
MGTLKSSNRKARRSASAAQRDAISETINQHIDLEVKFNDVRASLPRLLSGNHSVVKVNNRVSGDFIACTQEGLISLIQDVMDKQRNPPSFFDGMESFDTKEKIGMDVLNDFHQGVPERSKEDADVLKRLLKR